jgi:hypothetical protein
MSSTLGESAGAAGGGGPAVSAVATRPIGALVAEDGRVR